MRFYVVIPVFNRLPLTIRCLESLSAQTDKGMEIILIDDGSTDGTSEVVQERFPEVQVIRGDGTLWWSGAVNLGVRRALSSTAPDDYILLVNNDTYFESDFVARCRDAARKYPNTLVGSVFVDPYTGELHGGIVVDWYTAKFTWVNNGKSIEDFPPGHVESVSLLTGRGVIVPCKVYRDIGLYDDHYFEQHGDTEFSRRAYLNGYPLLVSYDLVTYNSDPDHAKRDTVYRPSDLFEYLFGPKAEARLRTRYWFAMKTSINRLQGLSYLVCDLARIFMHFLVRLRWRDQSSQ